MKLANEKSDSASGSKKYSDSELEQRSSLPDIPLTKREKAELESSMMIQGSHSSESILTGIAPPPKPSKDRKPSAPPLPPKRVTNRESAFDETDNSRQLTTRSEQLFGRKLDFNHYDDDAFGERTSSFSAKERHLFASRTSESESSQMMSQQSNKHSFSSIDTKECKIKISDEFNSMAFQSTSSSSVHEVENNFSLLGLSQSHFMTQANAASNESFSLMDTSSEEHPPPLPVKTRSRSLRSDHHKSVYDNVDHIHRNSLQSDAKASTTSSNSSLTSSLSARTENTNDFNHQSIVKNKYKSCIESRSNFHMEQGNDSDENPPPLPLKKKHSK